MRMVLLIIGVLAILAGVVWTLQGLNILGGSFMSGHLRYTLLGIVVAAVGLVLIVAGTRPRAPKA